MNIIRKEEKKDGKQHIIERIQETTMEMWKAAQAKKEAMDLVLPSIEKVQGELSDQNKSSYDKIEIMEALTESILENLIYLKRENDREKQLNSELGAAYGNMLELDFTTDRDKLAHLATFTENITFWIQSDPKLWSYFLGLVDPLIFADGAEVLPNSKLIEFRDKLDRIIKIRNAVR